MSRCLLVMNRNCFDFSSALVQGVQKSDVAMSTDTYCIRNALADKIVHDDIRTPISCHVASYSVATGFIAVQHCALPPGQQMHLP